MDIKFKVTGQKLMMLTKYNKFVSDAKDFMYLVFDLPREWLGYAVTAEFTQNGRIISKPLNTKNSIYLPSELSEGICLVSLRGESTASIVTTDSIALYIDKYVGSDGSGDNYITVELSTPTINITENGLITASVTQEEGYVLESSKQASLQLPVHDGGFVKPGKIDKIVTPSGVYTTGDLIVSGDANLDPSNIRKGSTIFDVQGTYEGYHGVELPELSDPGSAEDLVYGKEMIDGDGNVVTGQFELLSTEIAENAFLYAPNVGVREANGSKRIYFNTSIASRIGYEAGAPIQMEAVTANFGNAKPEDVIDGATFTSAEGLNESGKIPFLPTGQQGALGVVTEVRRVNYASYPVLRSLTQMPMRVAFDTNSIFQSDTPFHMLPDAEPNLVPGNIKKDVSIFNIVGTYESSDNGNNGIDLPTLSNPGSAEDLFHGKQLIDADGKIVNGTMEYITAENTSFILPSSNAVEYEDAYGKRVMMSIQLPSRLAFDTGSTVRMQSNLKNFGAAKPEDVIDGATFTSAEGLNVSGTLPFLPAGQRAYIGLAEEASRMDYAAYPVVRATAPVRVRLAMDAESSAQIDIPFGALPGAEPNLLAENIKKGVSIFDVVGTYEDSGNGSSGIQLPTLASPGEASDLIQGTELYDDTGTKVTGALPIILPDQTGIIAPATASKKYTNPDSGRNYLRAVFQAGDRFAMETNSLLNVDVPFSALPNYSLEPNLIASNIKKGVSVFDVVGTYEGSGSGTTLKTKEGTFTSGVSNMATINVDCGFAPTAVTILVYAASQRRQNALAFVNHPFGGTATLFHNFTDASDCAVYGLLEFTDTGFTISMDSKNSDGSANPYAFNREFRYYAIG